MAPVEFLLKETTRRKHRLVIVVVALHKDSDIAGLVYFNLKTDCKRTSAADRVTRPSCYRRHRDTRQHGCSIFMRLFDPKDVFVFTSKSLPTYSDRTSPIVPLFTIAPSSSNNPDEHRLRSAVGLWLTNNTVRPALRYVSHFIDATSLKFGVADRKYFVDEQNILVKVCGNSKRQSNVHSTGVMFHWSIDELLDFGKADDLIELATNFGTASCRESRH